LSSLFGPALRACWPTPSSRIEPSPTARRPTSVQPCGAFPECRTRYVVPAGTVTLAPSDADGGYTHATAHASMIPSQRGSARDLASQQHGVGGALQHLGRGFPRRAACSHECAMNRGVRVSTTYGWTAGNIVDRFRPRLVSHQGGNAAAPWFARDPRRAAPCRHLNCQRRVRGYQAEPFGPRHRR
jgi:hypothetical protein